jgi:hypothetical protein
VQQIFETQRAMFECWESLTSAPGDKETVYTDYVSIGE